MGEGGRAVWAGSKSGSPPAPLPPPSNMPDQEEVRETLCITHMSIYFSLHRKCIYLQTYHSNYITLHSVLISVVKNSQEGYKIRKVLKVNKFKEDRNIFCNGILSSEPMCFS